MLAASGLLFSKVPGSLVPQEDYVLMVTSLPPAAALSRTKAIQAITAIKNMPEVQGVVSFSGFDVLSSAQKTNSGVSFTTLKDWAERTDPKSDARQIAPALGRLNTKFHDGGCSASIRRRSRASARPGGSSSFCRTVTGPLWKRCRRQPTRSSPRPPSVRNSRASARNFRRRCRSTRSTSTATRPRPSAFLSIPSSMQSGFGSLYVNDFALFGRTYRVSLSSESDFRSAPNDLHFIYVRSASGAMIPLDALVSVDRSSDPIPSTASTSSPPPRFSAIPRRDIRPASLSPRCSRSWQTILEATIRSVGPGPPSRKFRRRVPAIKDSCSGC
ncbi:multidrug efflux pump subunit AcrB [Bradyrhizobium sp. LB7.1]